MTSYDTNIELVNEHVVLENADETFTHTGIKTSVINSDIDKLKAKFNTGFKISVTEGITDTVPVFVNKWPVICIISGVAGNGKDSFIEYMSRYASIANFSSIDQIKEIASVLCNATSNYNDLAEVDALAELNTKSDRYREFLWEMKQAWTKFCNGPTVQLLGMIRDHITQHNMQGDHTDIIFLHIREADQIEEMKTAVVDNFGLTPITVKIQGLVDATDYTNQCDTRVDEYQNFDVVINNVPGDTFMLEMKAMLFARVIKTTELGVTPIEEIETHQTIVVENKTTNVIEAASNNASTTESTFRNN